MSTYHEKTHTKETAEIKATQSSTHFKQPSQPIGGGFEDI
jgi:hypothetical protein